MTCSRRRLAILAAHAAEADPRIGWIAGTAKRDFDVLVLGIAGGRQPVGRAHDRDITFVHMPLSRGPLIRLLGCYFAAVWQARRRGGFLRRLPACAAHILVGLSLGLMLRLTRARVGEAPDQVLPDAASGRSEKDGAAFSADSTQKLFSRLKRWPERLPIDHPLHRLVRFFWLSRHLLQTNSTLLAALDIYAANESAVKVVHANDLDTLIAALAYRRRWSCRVVFDAHEFFPYSHAGSGAAHIWFFRTLEWFLLPMADAVCTINPLMAKEIGFHYGLPKVASVLNAEYWAEPESAGAGAEAVGSVKFLYLGGFAPARGLEELVDAWAAARIPNAVLILRGPDTPHRQALRNRVRLAGLAAESITFPPAVPEAHLIEAARGADIGIIPYKPVTLNYRLCCPNKLSQYLHAGLMIVANRTDYVAQVIEEEAVGLVYDSAEPQSLAAALRKAASDNAFRHACGARARKLGCTRFNWQAQEETLRGLYCSTTKDGPSAATDKALAQGIG